MLGNFQKCLVVTLGYEGGKVDNKKDPGGRTNKGVTQARYNEYRLSRGLPKRDVYDITDPEVSDVYQTGYWAAVSGDTLAPGVDLATFDAGVNSGPSRALGWLRASVGGPNDETVKKLCAKRLGFMRSLAIWKTFGGGWSKRVASVEAKGVAWALAALPTKPDVKAALAVEQKAAETKVTKNSTGAATTGAATTAGGGDVAINPHHADLLAGWILGGLLTAGVVMVAVLIIRAAIHKHRAEAYAAEAATL